MLHPQARLVVRNAAFYTPFRGWHRLDDVPDSEQPPSITGVSCLSGRASGSATVVMDHLICEGLKYCLDSLDSRITIKNSLFLENYEAVRHGGYAGLEIERSIFFRNHLGTYLEYCNICKVTASLFLQNNISMSNGYTSVRHSTFAQNAKAMASCDLRLTDVLFYGNDVAFSRATGILQNVTFLDNRLGLQITSKLSEWHGAPLYGINFLGSKEYHLHYTGTELFTLDLSSTYWNSTSLDELEAGIYDALDGSGAGVVQMLGAESMPDAPFHHGMYQNDPCAGQCNQHWFNTNWSSLISGGAGTFGFFDPERSLNSGQVLREALLTGHETPSSMSLSSYMQDVAGLLEAVGAFPFQTVGTTTSPPPSTTPSTTSTTTTTTTTLAAHLIRGADIVLTEPMWIKQNTTWTSDGIRALAKKVEVLPGVTLTIEGTRTSFAVLPSEMFFHVFFLSVSGICQVFQL